MDRKILKNPIWTNHVKLNEKLISFVQKWKVKDYIFSEDSFSTSKQHLAANAHACLCDSLFLYAVSLQNVGDYSSLRLLSNTFSFMTPTDTCTNLNILQNTKVLHKWRISFKFHILVMKTFLTIPPPQMAMNEWDTFFSFILKYLIFFLLIGTICIIGGFVICQCLTRFTKNYFKHLF